MKKFIKKFESAIAADGFNIVDIPFTTSVAPSSGYPLIDYIQNLVCNQTGKKLVNNNGIVSIYSDEPVPPVVPPNDEIWYTTTDGEPIDLSGGGSGSGSGADWPEYEILPYEGGKGIIKFTEDLTEIPSNGFVNIGNLETIAIPNSVTSIGDYAFAGCSGLTSVTIPNSVTSIGMEAFAECSSLASVTIPNNVTSIGEYAFQSCIGLTSVTIGNSVTSIGVAAFYNCSSLTSVTIGNSVTSIGDGAFAECSNLIFIIIPNSVTSIGDGAFDGCIGLTDITCEATTPPTLGSGALDNTNCPIYVPSQSVDTYKSASGWSDYASRIHAISTV